MFFFFVIAKREATREACPKGQSYGVFTYIDYIDIDSEFLHGFKACYVDKNISLTTSLRDDQFLLAGELTLDVNNNSENIANMNTFKCKVSREKLRDSRCCAALL